MGEWSYSEHMNSMMRIPSLCSTPARPLTTARPASAQEEHERERDAGVQPSHDVPLPRSWIGPKTASPESIRRTDDPQEGRRSGRPVWHNPHDRHNPIRIAPDSFTEPVAA